MKKSKSNLRIPAIFALISVFIFSGCFHQQLTDEETGEAFISLTDAPGDFLNYTVDVTSISLEKASGAMVETLPVTTRVDFSQYVDMTELVTAATISSGKYVKATMHLDFSNAEIAVEDDNGNAVTLSDFKDNDGNAVSQFSVSVNLSEKGSLIIVPGVPGHLSLDFDLKSSNHIDYDDANQPVGLTIDPTITASLEVDKEKDNRLRGALQKVDESSQQFSLIVRPFKQSLGDNRHFGVINVSVNDETTFEIDGQAYTGSEGLSQLALEDKLSGVIVFGQLKPAERLIEAKQVFAGDSVPSNDSDVVYGHVIGRTGDTLSVKGARLVRKNGSVHLGNTISVSISSDTKVTRAGDDMLGAEAISVGQRVTILGSASASSDDSFDATAGLVRLMLTDARGDIKSIDTSNAVAPLVMSVQKFDPRRVAIFDFSGTGSDAANDADPENYEVNTGSLNLSSMLAGDPVVVRGYVNNFGAAPADFNAQSIINLKNVAANLVVDWRRNNTNTLTINDDASIALYVEAENIFHHLVRRGIRHDLTEGGDSVKLVAANDGLWEIRLPHERIVHTRYDEFVADLEQHMSSGTLTVAGVKAHGIYDDELREMTATAIVVQFR